MEGDKQEAHRLAAAQLMSNGTAAEAASATYQANGIKEEDSFEDSEGEDHKT